MEPAATNGSEATAEGGRDSRGRPELRALSYPCRDIHGHSGTLSKIPRQQTLRATTSRPLTFQRRQQPGVATGQPLDLIVGHRGLDGIDHALNAVGYRHRHRRRSRNGSPTACPHSHRLTPAPAEGSGWRCGRPDLRKRKLRRCLRLGRKLRIALSAVTTTFPGHTFNVCCNQMPLGRPRLELRGPLDTEGRDGVTGTVARVGAAIVMLVAFVVMSWSFQDFGPSALDRLG